MFQTQIFVMKSIVVQGGCGLRPRLDEMSFKHSVECIYDPKSKTFKYFSSQTFLSFIFLVRDIQKRSKKIKIIVHIGNSVDVLKLKNKGQKDMK
jgi:hypothetical protein